MPRTGINDHDIKYMRWLDADELHRDEPHISKSTPGALEFTSDNHLNPFTLLECYREAAQRNGVTVLSETEVTGVEMSSGRVKGVRTSDGGIGCELLALQRRAPPNRPHEKPITQADGLRSLKILIRHAAFSQMQTRVIRAFGESSRT